MRAVRSCVSACVVLVAVACNRAPDPAWMSRVDDARGIGELVIPGTHDSGALHEPLAGLAKTQALTIAEQLEAGVRFLDLRARNVEDSFWLYHGALDQDQAFDDVFGAMYAFLDAHPSETILASLKEEVIASGATKPFDAVFAAYVARSPEHWLLDEALPSLGAARGKIVLVRRFATTLGPLGIDAAPWADNATFSIANAAALRVQDQYVVEDNEVKWGAVGALLDEARTPGTLYLDYTSGYQPTNMGLADILAVSTDINMRLDLRIASGALAAGVLVMDYVTRDRVGEVADMNR